MDAFLTSTLTVALAEIGDKTQLLSLFLAARYRQKWSIIAGIFVATVLNHFVSAWFGSWIVGVLPEDIATYIVSACFIAVGLWVLIPDKPDNDEHNEVRKYGAFIATTVLFFIAEIGDKTQVATIVLGAQYTSVVAVTLGTTLGMMVANVPVVLLGGKLMQKLPLDLARYIASAVFIILGVIALFW
ncbi:TMEM165/GDT1 family protein [Pseudidiomarina andamanensis]|uniref:GDT1 family protein n=1 Tax=Pseudidiomarina andamanensis TaxID=1940690 RepID=A0AA92ESZ6_9GAMM|nr:TMEM165/GDT1 family protein [Pseudidiomarina andamanensis]MDS0219409.1 TMEM165/GDT1 family protein [Pseudidiomarina andamanensis]QGT96132.1 TMEM165/GDT1 family protein [Pseudidiomarina andamanensis]